MNRMDTGRQVKPGLGHAGPGDDDEDEDEAVDEGTVSNANATQGSRIPGVRAEQDEDEASEVRQKGAIMGNKGRSAMKDGQIKGQSVSDSEEESNPAHKVTHGREEPKGHEAEIEGAHQGDGHGGEPRYFSNLGHGEREATISGAHQGQHGKSQSTGSGFEAGGDKRKENARGDKL